jgi:hypothetical protein
VISDAIYSAIKRQKEQPDIYLSRLGASGIGAACLRSVFYDWRKYSKEDVSGRIYRLFETGHLQEERIVADLRSAGFSVWDKDENGNQFTYVDDTGHFVCKIDGVVSHTLFTNAEPTVLEIKTHSKKSFDETAKKGVQKAKPEHYVQMQAGIWLSGIPRALYVALCKDNEQYYTEHVDADQGVQDWIKERIKTLVTSDYLPARISEDSSGWNCTYCKSLKVCSGEMQPLKHCRSCRNLIAIADGDFGCELDGTIKSRDEQLQGCESYDARI